MVNTIYGFTINVATAVFSRQFSVGSFQSAIFSLQLVVRDWIMFYEQFWDDKLDRLGKYLELRSKQDSNDK